jgi:LPXTG-site transpeptidase (sortase) family protein
MPISQLQSIDSSLEKTPVAEAVDYIQETLKKPFSWEALTLSLGLGLVVALIVTGALLGYNYLSNTSSNDADKSLVTTATFGVEIDVSKQDSDFDGLFDWQESLYGTNAHIADSDFDGFLDGEEVLHGFDPTGFGRPEMTIKIEKLILEAPISFPVSRDEADIQAAMAKGVAYYPGTATPGNDGNIYLTGHSSDYAWNPGNFKNVFRKLNDLVIGDRVVISQMFNSGQVVEFEYEVYDKQVTAVDNLRLWHAERDGSILTLVTSWPIDSTKERLMVRGILVSDNN